MSCTLERDAYFTKTMEPHRKRFDEAAQQKMDALRQKYPRIKRATLAKNASLDQAKYDEWEREQLRAYLCHRKQSEDVHVQVPEEFADL